MRAGILGVVLCLAAPAPGDATTLLRERLRALDAKEKTAWDGFQNRFADALVAFVRPWARAHSEPDYPQDATWDYEPVHRLYADFVALREARAEAAESLASAGDAGAAAAIFAELLDAAKDADGAEATLEKPLPPVGQSMCDQRPGVLRHAIGREWRRLLPALARCPGAAALLAGEGWGRAEKGDGRDSILRRVAVLDTLALAGTPEARAFLENQAGAKGSSLRIAAAEGLLLLGKDATPALLPLLRDPCPLVRYAVLETLRARKDPDPRWIRAVVEAYPAEQGRLRGEHLATLRALTGAAVGDDPAAWKEWLKGNAAAVDGGTFLPPPAPPVAPATDPAPASCSFYRVAAATLRPVFVVDGSFVLRFPAEVEVQRTRNSSRWETRPKARWMDPPPVQHGILLREWKRTLKGMPPGTAFALLALYGKNDVHPFEDGRLVKPDPAVAKDSAEFLEKLCQAGSCGPFEALREAMRAAGLDPAAGAEDFPRPLADTVFLLQEGSPRGGRFVGAEPAVDAFRRLNRFRRLAVHCIRIANGKEEAEATMKGIAAASGGTYAWWDKPPPE